jgi:hypothetical protein
MAVIAGVDTEAADHQDAGMANAPLWAELRHHVLRQLQPFLGERKNDFVGIDH